MPQDQTAPDSAASGAEAAPFSVGAALKEARVQQGLSVEDVSGRIKFAPRQIEALEADDFAHVPENAFLRGFVRSYARLLQLDPAPLLNALPHEPEAVIPPEAKATEEMPYPGIYDERKWNIIWLAAALGVAVLLGLFAWLFSGKPKEQVASVQETPGTKVEMLALPAAVPVSAVPEADLLAHQQAIAEKTATEKMKPVTGKVAAEKAAQEKTKTEKQAAEKPAEKPKSLEVKKAPQAAPVPASAVPPVKTMPATAGKQPVPSVPATITSKSAPASPAQKAVPPAPAAEQSAVKKQAVPATPASAVQAAKTQGQSPAKPSGSGPIRVTFSAESWVEIKDAEGRIVMSLLGHDGVEQSTGGKAPFTVTVGYASGVKLYYKGKQVDLAPHARSEVAHLTLE